MTDKQQPKALRIADELEEPMTDFPQPTKLEAEAAAELRRLHAENETLRIGYAAARLEIGSLRAAQPAGAQQSGVAYAALPDADRDYMRKVVAVAVTMLFDGYKEDVTRVFSPGELSEFVTITAAMGGERVEDIYRRAWDLLSLPDRASHGQAPAQPVVPAFTEAQIASACLSYRHDFGLLGETDRKSMMWIARQWERAFAKEREFAAPAQAAPAAVTGPSEAVAYLDIGTGGYLDIGTDLTDEALSRLPKGRHALVIAGTYGIDGYTAAPTTQPAPQQEAQEPVALLSDDVVRDAVRYRWLREGNDAKHGAAWHVAVNLYGCEWDAAIDAAIAAQGDTP